MTNIITRENAATAIKVGGLDIRYTNDITSFGSNWTLFSSSGGGKTTFPSPLIDNDEFGPLLYVASGAGLQTIQDMKAPYVVPEKWQDLEKIQKEFKNENTRPPFKAVALDNLSEYLVLAKEFVCPVSGYPEGTNALRDWNKITELVKQYIRDWRDLTEHFELHVFFIAWDDGDDSTTDATKKLTIDLNPALQKALPGTVDTIGHIDILRKDPDHRIIDFTPGPRTISKFRRSKSDNARKIPYRLYYDLDHLPIIDILNTIRNGTPFPDTYKVPTTAGAS